MYNKKPPGYVIPLNFLIDREGKIAWIKKGYYAKQLENKIKALVKSK